MTNESYITNRPFEATDVKPYIFISYKHDDWRDVYPIIDRFHKEGYNVWYDAALTKGQNYDIEIANKIKNSDLFITFLSELVMERANDQDDYLVKELSVAIKKKRPRLFIYLESVGSDDLDGYYLMNCNGIQAIFKNDYPNNDDMFIDECLTTFKYHFKMEPNAVEEDSQDEELEIAEVPDEKIQPEEVTPKPSMSQMDELSEKVNSLSDVYHASEDIVDKMADNVYGLYEDNARRYLADAYGMLLEHTYLDSEILYGKYGSQADSFEDRLSNLKSKKHDMRAEVINRIKGLNSIGYEIAGKDDERKEVSEFTSSEEIELAKYNHYVWCENRITANEEYGYEGLGADYLLGVVLGSIRSDMDIITPYRDSLVLWDDLSNYEQEENIDFINRIFKYLSSDLKIVKLRIINPKSHLKDLINSGVKEIVLDCDIIFDEENRNDIKIFDDDLTIDGDGHTIDANKKSRIFTIRGKNITIKNLTFKNGATDRNGGAVFVHKNGSCSFSDCHFINNSSSPGILKVKTEGGAIYNEGFCRLDSCVFEENNMGDEHSRSKDIAPFESFELNDCTFDEKAEDAPEPLDQLEPADEKQTGKSDFKIKEQPLPEPYEGDEPYIFVSYKHADSDIVFPLIRQFSDAGLNVWYDNAINVGADSDIQIANHIKKASLFVSMITENMMNSSYDGEDYAVKELAVATRRKIPCLPIYLEDVALDGSYILYYMGKPSVFKHEYDDESLFIESCISTLKEELDSQADENNQSSESEGFKTQIKLPAKAYEGNDPYIFVSYAHTDANVVFPEIERFANQGFNVWYDEGVAQKGEWAIHIEDRLINSSLVTVFMSNNAVESNAIRNEIYLALNQSIPILPIYMEETELKYGLRLALGTVQSINRYSIPEDQYVSECLNAFKRFGFKPNAGQKQDKHNFKYLDPLIENNSEIVLDSDILFDDVGYERGIEIKKEIVIDGAGHTIDAKGKARIFNISNNVTLKNINFENGFAESGGAVIINPGARVTVESCNFKDNHADKDGGAILNKGNIEILNSRFITNDSKNRGGAIKNWEGSKMEISASEFDANSSIDGAAVSNRGILGIYTTRFFQNEAADSAGGVVNFNDCSIRGCDFSNNISNGTTEVNGGGALFNYKGSLEVIYSKFEDNHSILGGGAIYNQDGELLIENSDFRRNSSDGQGNSIANTENASILINRSQFDETQSNEIFSKGKMQLNGDCKFKEEDIIEKPSKRDVFISYTTKDANIANEVCNVLESNGIACWIAPRDISTGSNYVEQILDGIKNASKFLVIYSREYSKSRYAKAELDKAFNLEKQLIPFNIDGSDVDDEFKFLLGNVQWIDARKDSNYSSLVNALKGNADLEPEPKKKGLRSRLFGR